MQLVQIKTHMIKQKITAQGKKPRTENGRQKLSIRKNTKIGEKDDKC